MAHHYTTKALGRVWAPPSSPTIPTRVSSRGRFGAWPTVDRTPRQQHAAQESWFSDLRILRGRLAERLAVLLALSICISFLAYHHDRFITPGVHVWTHSIHRLRLGGSLIPFWTRVNWSQYAYVSYATTDDHVCNSLMLAESLHRLGAKPDILILHAAELTTSSTSVPSLLAQARAQYGAKTSPIPTLSTSATAASDPSWSQSLTKLHAFNQTQYARVLSLDSDATLLQAPDELFLLPKQHAIALPSAYWLNATLCTALMLVTPSAEESARVRARVDEKRDREYDMDVVNALYAESAVVLPHRPYLLLTGEMRKGRGEHGAFLGGEEEAWSARRAVEEAKYVHFSDWPVPKPWVPSEEGLRGENAPECSGEGGGEDCEDRDVWFALYGDFRRRRKVSLPFPFPIVM